ncbi:Unknown protein sequence [Pseudomonas syringae pv. maculicola]|nr:Unknown protein sequence [Pseudomonas syringae pv. maculicola]
MIFAEFVRLTVKRFSNRLSLAKMVAAVEWYFRVCAGMHLQKCF